MEQESRTVPDWLQQMAAVILLAGCIALAMPRPKPEPNVDVLTSVASSVTPAKPQQLKKNKLPPDAREFTHLLPQIRRQVLDYASKWIDANFEKTG